MSLIVKQVMIAEAGCEHGPGAPGSGQQPAGAWRLVPGLSPGSREQEKHQIQGALSSPGQNTTKNMAVVHL